MTIKEAVHELNEDFKKERITQLEKRIEQLEKILINTLNRLEYLENHQCR